MKGILSGYKIAMRCYWQPLALLHLQRPPLCPQTLHFLYRVLRLQQLQEAARSTSSLSYTPIISPSLVITAIAIALIVSIIASIYPSRKASMIDPIAALRNE